MEFVDSYSMGKWWRQVKSTWKDDHICILVHLNWWGFGLGRWLASWPFLAFLPRNRPKIRKMANLLWALQAQNLCDGGKINYECGLLYRYFHAVFTIFTYYVNSKTRFLRKQRIILLRDIYLGLVWFKRCGKSWNSSRFMVLFYLTWFGAEMSPNCRGHFFLPPL